MQSVDNLVDAAIRGIDWSASAHGMALITAEAMGGFDIFLMF